MDLFALHEDRRPNTLERIAMLRRASEERGLGFVALDSSRVDYSALPILKPGDLLYNAARGSRVLESALLRDHTTTFYRANPGVSRDNADTTGLSMLMDKAGIATPRTVYQLTRDRTLLRRYVDALGGFPIVLKVVAGTRGIGVLRADNFPALFSLADYLISIDARFILREYIEAHEVGRLIVLGERVIAARAKQVAVDDFRSDARGIEPTSKRYSAAVEELAVAAARAAGVEFGGVDVILDRDDEAYVLEINTPFDFVGAQHHSGVDIVGLALEHLIAKSVRCSPR